MKLADKFSEYLLEISPSFYKKKYYQFLENVNFDNVLDKNLDPELVWVKNILNADSVFIDVGASSGKYLKMLEDVLQPENIYAFEPNLTSYKRLKKLFPSINLHPYALSSKNELVNYKIPIINQRVAHYKGTLQIDVKIEGEEKSIRQKVISKRFDDWAEKNLFKKIDFIKIDVEGNEAYTLAGMVDTLLRCHPILMIEMQQQHHKRPVWEYIQYFERYGYLAHYLDKNNFNLKPLTLEKCQEKCAINTPHNHIIFIPKK